MGIAIILNSANFAAKNLGKVTIVQDVEVESMGVIAEDSYEGMTAQLTATYNPASTNQKGCTWSIVEGGTYASIDNTGLLTIKSGANNSSVKVRATNAYNNNIYAEKIISVTYNDAADYLTSISINNGTAENNTIQFSVIYNPDNTMYKDVTWSIESGSEYAEIDGNGLLSIKSGASNNAVVVKATSTHDGSISDSKSVNVTFVSRPIVFADPAVKAIVLQYADTDGDGEISSAEADAVTTLNKAGTNNSTWFCTNGNAVDASITSFDELGEFHNVKKLDVQYGGTFTKCTSLTSINLDNIETIGVNAFSSCTNLVGTNGTNIVKLPNIKEINGNNPFDRTKCYIFDLGENLTSLSGTKALVASDSYGTTVIFRGATPPTNINQYVLSYNATKNNVICYAPDASLDAYKAAFEGKHPTNIVWKNLSEYVES